MPVLVKHHYCERTTVSEARSTYEDLLALLEREGAAFRLIDHRPEGRTDLVSAMRDHPAAHAAKCIIVMVKLGKKITKYILAVVPGDARVDLGAIKTLTGATYVGFASPEIAEELARSPLGTVLPFAFDDRLEVIVDPQVLALREMFFNAARLDRSIALAPADYARIAKPRIQRIALG
jgi:Ala-tRNA(Pro) deacylase